MALLQLEWMASSIERWTTVWVYYPDNTNEGPLKAVILLHGYQGNHTDFLTLSPVRRLAEEKGLLLVMPDGDNSFYLDYPERAEAYETYIAKELPSLIRKAFPVGKDRDHLFVLGLSMGGGGALRLGAKYGDVFGKAVSLSGEFCLGERGKTLGHGADVAAALEEAVEKKALLPQMYLTCGTEDFLLEENRYLHEVLLGHHLDHEYREAKGAHTWGFWAREMPLAFSFLEEKETGKEGRAWLS